MTEICRKNYANIRREAAPEDLVALQTTWISQTKPFWPPDWGHTYTASSRCLSSLAHSQQKQDGGRLL